MTDTVGSFSAAYPNSVTLITERDDLTDHGLKTLAGAKKRLPGPSDHYNRFILLHDGLYFPVIVVFGKIKLAEDDIRHSWSHYTLPLILYDRNNRLSFVRP